MSYRAFIIAGFLIFTHGCSDSNNDDGFGLSPVDPVVPPASPIEPTNSSLPEWLYVQTAATAQMTSDTILEIPFTRDVFGFTDIPNRKHAYFTASEFEALWSEEGANSFSADPPNAVLTWLVGEEQREAEVIINNATVYSDGTQESLVYEVTLETEQMPDAQMSFVALYAQRSGNNGPQLLFVQTSDGAVLTDSTLTLTGISPQTTWFTERPYRQAGQIPTEEFPTLWDEGENSFANDPPNADFTCTADGEAVNYVVELTMPEVTGDELTYAVEGIGDINLPDTAVTCSGTAQLFIDGLALGLGELRFGDNFCVLQLGILVWTGRWCCLFENGVDTRLGGGDSATNSACF